jgi:hypothetical protein
MKVRVTLYGGIVNCLMPRLGYGWLGSAFDGFRAITGISQPSHF